MKIIDLLNKIANDEEVPEKIKFENNIYNAYYYENKVIDYYYTDELKNQRTLFDDSMYDYGITSYLNDEIEILEEEKKIPEKLDIRQEKNIKNNWKWKVYGEEHSYNISTPQKIIADKLNEVLDYLESKGE